MISHPGCASTSEQQAGYRTNLLNVCLKIWSKPPRKTAATIERTITTTVRRAVSSRLGQTDFLSSETVSCRNSTGLTRFAILGVRAVTRAMLLPYLAVPFVATTTWAILLKLYALWVVPPVFGSRIVPFPAVSALESDNLSDVGGFSSHNLLYHLRNNPRPNGAASLPDSEPHLFFDGNGSD